MINTSKPTTSLINSVKVSFAETWNSIVTTWASETRTWDMTGSLFTNTTKQSSPMTNIIKPA